MNDLIFFGDSNTAFFNASINNTTDDLEFKPIEFWTGYEKQNILGHNIHFFWQTTLAMTRVTKSYLNNRIREQDIKIDSLDNPIFIFQFGRVDLQLKNYNFFQIENALVRYISECYGFAQLYGAELFFTTPIANLNSLDIKLADHFDNLLFYYCEQFGIKEPIDITSMVGRNFKSEPWDKHLHLDKQDSRIVLEKILSYSIK